MLREVRRFNAYADDSTEYTIVEYVSVREVRTMHGVARVPGLGELQTDDGQHVNFVADGVNDVLAPLGSIRVRTR